MSTAARRRHAGRRHPPLQAAGEIARTSGSLQAAPAGVGRQRGRPRRPGRRPARPADVRPAARPGADVRRPAHRRHRRQAAGREELDLTNPTSGWTRSCRPRSINENLQDVNVDTKVVDRRAAGVGRRRPRRPVDVIPPAGIGRRSLDPGGGRRPGTSLAGLGRRDRGDRRRSGSTAAAAATRSKLVGAGGGNAESEAAVARGLAWLAKQQKANGSWVFDGSSQTDPTAATGHGAAAVPGRRPDPQGSKDNKYNKNVEAGLKFLVAQQKPNGSFNGATACTPTPSPPSPCARRSA